MTFHLHIGMIDNETIERSICVNVFRVLRCVAEPSFRVTRLESNKKISIITPFLLDEGDPQSGFNALKSPTRNNGVLMLLIRLSKIEFVIGSCCGK